MSEDLILDLRKPKETKKNKLLNDLEGIDDTVVLPSSIKGNIEKKKAEKKEEKKKKKEQIESDTDEWLNELSSFTSPKVNKKRKFKGFDLDAGEKKKKKKNKKVTNSIDYGKHFETELNALQNLYIEQSKFTSSLQKEYDVMKQSKSSNRGVSKYTTDLANSITSARLACLNVMKDTINTKKTIADLNMKNKEKFGSKDSEVDSASYATNFLKSITDIGRNTVVNASINNDNVNAMEIDEENISSFINDVIGDDIEPNSYLKYNDRDVTLYVVRHDNGEWEFYPEDKDGNYVEDFECPSKDFKMSFNFELNQAQNELGQKFPLIIKE